MQRLIREIRERLNVSQDDMAKMIGTSYATVNRWENGHSRPGKAAQLRLNDICREKGINLEELVLAKIDRVVSELKPRPESLILYHGSKSGIKGPIAPISRDRCDFGKGFYMGTDPYSIPSKTPLRKTGGVFLWHELITGVHLSKIIAYMTVIWTKLKTA